MFHHYHSQLPAQGCLLLFLLFIISAARVFDPNICNSHVRDAIVFALLCQGDLRDRP